MNKQEQVQRIELGLPKSKIRREIIHCEGFLGLFGGSVKSVWKVKVENTPCGWFQNWEEAVEYAIKTAKVAQLAAAETVMGKASEISRLRELNNQEATV